ncbi:uncharacterized protein Z518_02287 [Rhinocladiella mackenziei CBS 650.93]|uniref:Fork-head domain-containing protein n=1 Tax=Rhinocladiella mackenziei CBS 650.93 TaxID=1442369 RepID=A0A0D2IP55_9EURO|nr:uncharacterized protein Z518_02287 [Rhinocladiella mackenziei CBS 650.93]KIX07634.1 hypothetical protein Z518_02287 [Rhinocladiella mackenziei CBS 650.93]
MSSQAIATSTRGLRDFHSPIDVHNFSDSPWSDHSNSHNTASKPEDELNQNGETQSPTATQPSWNEMDAQQRNRAVGNLLAALVPVSPTQTTTAAAQTDLAPVANKSDDTFKPRDNHLSTTPAETTESTNDNVNPTLNTSHPPLPPLSNDGLMDEHGPPPFPPPLPLDSLERLQTEVPATESFTMPSQMELQPPIASQGLVRERREVEAFAKIEFEDGNYYITTYACELGRDAFAYRAALVKAEEERLAGKGRAQSSSGRRSGLSEGISRPGDSQVQGSVVSEAGGFGGVDDGPILEEGDQGDAHPIHSHSSERSAGSVVKPQEVLINPPLIPFDYHKMSERQAQLEQDLDADQDNELPAPVTADHIPDANNCPLIPIHAMRNFQKSELENHRSISRRHVKIQWDFDKECFIMIVLGRNGAFLDDQYLQRGSAKRLRDGSKIQISNVWMTFRLPNRKTELSSDDSEREEGGRSPPPQRSTSPTSNEPTGSISPSRNGKNQTKVVLTTGQKASLAASDPLIGPDGQPLPPRKRGPGRPPKDGIMSTRERREREKAQKLADAKAANGGKTPPPSMKGKMAKPTPKEEVIKADPKPEKRKYKKRKRSGEDGDILQSIEGGEIDLPSEPEKPPTKKARQSKSPTPEYPALESLTEEQLARPSEPYARLIYDILTDIYPKALPLRQIYRALKLKFPFFVYRVDSEGWQSSVRHNLNQEWNKLFEKGEKEGKGFAWKAIPGALQPQAERRRAAQQAAAAKPKPTSTPRQHPPQGPPPLNWQNSTPYAQQHGMPPRGPPPPFFVQGPNGQMPPPPNGIPWPLPPPPPPAGGMPTSTAPNTDGSVPAILPPGQHPPFYPPPQAGHPSFTPQRSPSQSGPDQATPPAHQGPPRSSPSASTPVPPSSIPTSSSASRNMPCTTDGLIAIRRFENAMYQQVGDPTKIEYWQRIFASVKRRLLHGAPHSLLPEGETKEELTIMEHVRRFIERFKNPNFVGFSLEQPRGTSSPAPVNMANAGEKPSSSQPVIAPVPAETGASITAEGAPKSDTQPNENESSAEDKGKPKEQPTNLDEPTA